MRELAGAQRLGESASTEPALAIQSSEQINGALSEECEGARLRRKGAPMYFLFRISITDGERRMALANDVAARDAGHAEMRAAHFLEGTDWQIVGVAQVFHTAIGAHA